MKKLFVFYPVALFLLGLLMPAMSFAQQRAGRTSPADSVSGTIGKANVTINYSSPSVKERKIWGELVPYGAVWRSGANEATTFQTDRDVVVEGKPLAAGRYSFFTIPGENEWTIIFNKEPKQWGAFKYDEKQDALRVTVKPRKAPAFHERLVYLVNKDGIVLQWENLEVPVAIK